jgi:NTE family protein
MALKKGATFVIAVDLSTAGLVRKEPLRQAEALIHLHSPWDLGSILVFDGVSATRNIRLGYLEALKAFGFYEGKYYSFSKGEFGKRELAAAETTAKLFGLSPTYLYNKTTFQKRLTEAVTAYRGETQQSLAEFHKQINGLQFRGQPLRNLLGRLNEKTLTLLILDYLKEHPENRNALVSRSMWALFKREATAAGYLFRI